MVAVAAIGFAYSTGLDVKGTLITAAGAFLMCAAVIAIEIPLLHGSSRKMKILIDDDRIVKKCGQREQGVSWQDIVKVKLGKSPRGSVELIRLYYKKKEMMYLHGFNEMETIANLISQKISDKVLVKSKRGIIYTRDPLLAIVIGAVIITVLLITASMSNKAMNVLAILAISGLGCIGCWLLIFRPFTKYNLNTRWFEIILAAMAIILGIAGLIVFTHSGGLP
jgi:hypothetical protein